MGKTKELNENKFASFFFLPFPREPFFNLSSAQLVSQRAIGDLVKERTKTTDN